MKKTKYILAVTIASLAVAGWGLSGHAKSSKKKKGADAKKQEEVKSAPKKEFTVIGIDYKGTKVWVPGTLIVRKGDKVKIKAITKIGEKGSTHGYAIDEFGVKLVVANGTPQAVTFTADKAGIFKIYCHQHPAHIGGQLLVLE